MSGVTASGKLLFSIKWILWVHFPPLEKDIFSILSQQTPRPEIFSTKKKKIKLSF